MSDPSPPRLLPVLAGGSGVPADPSAHQMEPKFDGVRAVVTIHDETVSITSRLGNDVTGGYPEFAALAGALEGG